MKQKLLDARDYELIKQLNLMAKRRIAGLVSGEQNSPVQGGGIEFADYREYQPGDDIRRVDWSVFLRLRRLLVKLCAEEKELTLLLILDTSRSMNFGDPDKLWVAKRIAAVLAGIALYDGNRAGVVTMGQKLCELLPPERSRITLAEIVNAIQRIEPAKQFNPMACISQFASRYGRKCMAVMISDMLFPEWSQVINGLAASGCESHLIHTLAPEEFDPDHLGEVTLVDLEGAGEVALHIDLPMIKQYRQVLEQYLKDIRQTCHREGLGYSMISTALPLSGVLHRELTKGGLLC